MRVYPPCKGCRRAMVSNYRPAPAGMVQHGAHGYCDACDRYYRRNGTHPEPMPFDARPWVDRAACAEVDGDLWFPEVGSNGNQAKAICARCEVRAECLDWAVTHEEMAGIWGGLSSRERRRMWRRGAA